MREFVSRFIPVDSIRPPHSIRRTYPNARGSFTSKSHLFHLSVRRIAHVHWSWMDLAVPTVVAGKGRSRHVSHLTPNPKAMSSQTPIAEPTHTSTLPARSKGPQPLSTPIMCAPQLFDTESTSKTNICVISVLFGLVACRVRGRQHQYCEHLVQVGLNVGNV